MYDIIVMKVVNSFEDLTNGLGCIQFGEFAVFADPIEQLSAGSELRDDVVFVLNAQSSVFAWP